jgi:hypothetical protein
MSGCAAPQHGREDAIRGWLGAVIGPRVKQVVLAAAICALTACSVPMQTVDASRAACASYGFQPGSDAFAECVMTEQHRHTLLIYGGGAGAPVPAVPQTVGGGQPVISSGDCIGAVVNGVCHGTFAPGAATATCHGQMVAGVCTGPMF